MQTQLQTECNGDQRFVLARRTITCPFMSSLLTLWYSLLFSHSRSFSIDLLVWKATVTLDDILFTPQENQHINLFLMWDVTWTGISPSCWGRWQATNWSPMCSSSRGSHTGATARSLAASSSGSCLHGWYWLWIPLVPPEEVHIHGLVNIVTFNVYRWQVGMLYVVFTPI